MNGVRISVFAALVALGCSSNVPEEAELDSSTQRLVDPGIVLGFEDVSQWTASAGTKTSNPDHTQGSSSLGLANFTFAELTSTPFTTLTGVTSSIGFDIKTPVVPSWGTAQLFVSVPSRNLHNASLGSVSLAGSTAGSWRTLSFNVPANVMAVLAQSYSDLKFKIALNAPQGSQPYLVDNLRFIGNAAENVVTLNVSNVDDFLYVTVNGLRRKVVPLNGVVSETISDWFIPGTNKVRIQAVNTVGPSSYSAQIRVDGSIVVDANCASAPCAPGVSGGAGILFDQTYDVVTPNRPAAKTLTVNDASSGKIYINDAYTGLSAPATFTLPSGEYLVGLGVGEGTTNAYVGQYFEQSVQLSSNTTITPSLSAPLSFPNHTRVAVLPIRRSFNGGETPAHTGVLTEHDIELMHGQTIATNNSYVRPFSYGLTTWDIDLLPTVEETPFRRKAERGDPGDINAFLEEAKLTSLPQTYDIIIYYFSMYTESGDLVLNDPCCWWGIGQSIWFSNRSMRDPGVSPDSPNIVLLHESLHDYESYNDGRLRFYNGIEGTHGAEYHGYIKGENGEHDFAKFYRDYMRNQVAEVNTMRGGVIQGSRPATADLWTGVFDTMRRDVDWHSSVNAATLSAPVALPAPRSKRFIQKP